MTFKVGDRVRQKSKEEVEKIGLAWNSALGSKEFTVANGELSGYIYAAEWSSGGFYSERLERANPYADEPETWI